MSQVQEQSAERRGEPRRAAAFAFWFESEGTHRRHSAWMLNTSSRGAAFLASAEDAPGVGERLALVEMLSRDRLVRDEKPAMPRFARVLRVDDGGDITRKVAVRFEADSEAELPFCRTGRFVASCPGQPVSPMVPPALLSGRELPIAPVPVATAD